MFKTRFISILALLMVAVTGAWAEDYYNVTFSGFDVPALNTTVTTTLPKDFTAGEQGHKFSAWNIYDDGNTLSNVTVSGGNGKVSSSIYNDDFLKITVSGAFDGNATIHVSGVRDGGGGFEADITVTCVSANEAFDVTYDANGGSGAPSAQEKRKDTDLTLSSDVPTRTGYTFAGWNTAQDGSGDSYAPGATYTANADVTLYAQWTAPAASTYTVTLKEGTDDATSWTIAPAEATTTGVAAGTEVKATYGGTKKVKSVKAVKKAPAAAYTMAANATAGDVGKLICTDGHIHANGEDAACTKARVAKIIYVGSSTDNTTYTHGLALALEDVSSNLSWDNSGYYNNSKTAAEWCSAWNTSKNVTSASWMLPSKDQWNTMISAAGGTTSLRDGFNSIAGASNLTTDTYWSSTEYDSDKAWCYGFNSGDWYRSWKDMESKVRACLAF